MYKEFLIKASEPYEIIDTHISGFFNNDVKPYYNVAIRQPIIDAFKKFLNKKDVSIIDVEDSYLNKVKNSSDVDRLFQLGDKEQKILAVCMLMYFNTKLESYPDLKNKIVELLKDDAFGLLLLLFFELIPKDDFIDNPNILTILKNNDYYIKSFIDITKHPNQAIEEYYKSRNNYKDNEDYYRMLQQNNQVPYDEYFNNYRYSELDRSTNKNIKFANDNEALAKLSSGEASFDQILQYAKLIAKKQDWKELEDKLLNDYKAGLYGSFDRIIKYVSYILNRKRWIEFEDLLREKLKNSHDARERGSVLSHLYKYWAGVADNDPNIVSEFQKQLLNSYRNDGIDIDTILDFMSRFNVNKWDEIDNAVLEKFRADHDFNNIYKYFSNIKKYNWDDFKLEALRAYINNYINYNAIDNLVKRGEPWDDLVIVLDRKLLTNQNYKDIVDDYVKYMIKSNDNSSIDKLKNDILDYYKRGIIDYKTVKDYIIDLNINYWQDFVDALVNKGDIDNLLDYKLFKNQHVSKQEMVQYYKNGTINSILPLKTYFSHMLGLNEKFTEIRDVVLDKFKNGKWKFEDFKFYLPQLLDQNNEWKELETYLKNKNKIEELNSFLNISGKNNQQIFNILKNTYSNNYKKNTIKYESVINFLTNNLQSLSDNDLDSFLDLFISHGDSDGIYSFLYNCPITDSRLQKIETYIKKYIQDLRNDSEKEVELSRYLDILESIGKQPVDPDLNNPHPNILRNDIKSSLDNLRVNRDLYFKLINEFFGKLTIRGSETALENILGLAKDKNGKLDFNNFKNFFNLLKSLNVMKNENSFNSLKKQDFEYYSKLTSLLNTIAGGNDNLNRIIDKIKTYVNKNKFFDTRHFNSYLNLEKDKAIALYNAYKTNKPEKFQDVHTFQSLCKLLELLGNPEYMYYTNFMDKLSEKIASNNRSNYMDRVIQSYTQKYINEFLPGLLRQAKSVKDLSTIVRVAINETQNLMFNDGQLITLNQPEVVNQIGNTVVDTITDDYVFPATGGAADNMSLKMIVERWKQQPEYEDISFEELLSTAKKELEAGKVVELEHTNDENQAAKIAADHLTEQINYYSYLHNMEELFSDENVANKDLAEPENFITTFFKDVDRENINNAQEHVCDGSCGGNCQCHTQEVSQVKNSLDNVLDGTVVPFKPQTVEDKLNNMGGNVVVTIISDPQEMKPLTNEEVKAVDFINNIVASLKR